VTRRIEWEGCLNVRDLGGVALADGGETPRGVLFRGDSVSKLTAGGWRALEERGVTRIVDLRWREERAADPPRDVDVEVVHVSVLGAYDEGVDDGVEEFLPGNDAAGYRAQAYASWLERYRPLFVDAVRAIADARGPVLFHCAGGKDRTGLVAALLLRLAGAPPAEVAADYALSERYLLRGDEDERERFARATPAEAMARTLEHLDRTYGSAEEYLRGGGLDDARIARLKELLAAPRA
jgi:protein-tyrosine phosphatase